MHKTMTALVLAGAVAASLACNRGTTTPAPTTPATPASPTAAPTTPAAPATNAAPATPAAGIAGEPIPDFPDYPGATRVGYEVGGPKPEYKSKVEAKFTTPDTLDKVKAHYQQAVTSGGWTVVKQKDTPAEVEWTVSKAGSTVEIDIEVNPAGGTKVSVERKNMQ